MTAYRVLFRGRELVLVGELNDGTLLQGTEIRTGEQPWAQMPGDGWVHKDARIIGSVSEVVVLEEVEVRVSEEVRARSIAGTWLGLGAIAWFKTPDRLRCVKALYN